MPTDNALDLLTGSTVPQWHQNVGNKAFNTVILNFSNAVTFNTIPHVMATQQK